MTTRASDHKAILQALHDRHTADPYATKRGFGPAQIAYIIVLGTDGKIEEIVSNLTADKKPRPRTIQAPMRPKRTAGVASGAFWDKTSYVLGRTFIDPALSPEMRIKEEARLSKEHTAFKERHEVLLAGNSDPDSVALLNFLRSWNPADYDTLNPPADMLDADVAFKLDDGRPGYVHDRIAEAALDREQASAGPGDLGVCLVTGEEAPIARLHPSIKGVPGAQSSGAALVSFNLDAFNSYGKTQGFNAPVSVAAAEGYAAALNKLLAAELGRDEKGRPKWANRIGLGGDTVVFWAETGLAERLTREMLDPQAPATPLPSTPPGEVTEIKQVRDIMAELESGGVLENPTLDIDPRTHVYILGLAPNAARLSVRFWFDQTLGRLARSIQEHWNDLRLEPAPRRSSSYPIWMLLQELAAQRKTDNVPDNLSGDVMRAIVTGGRYPASLFIQTIMRIRADHDRTDPIGRTLEKVSGLRVAILKACLARDFRKKLIKEDVPVSLDPNSPNAGYQLGRLFAVLERLQRAALGQRNATVRDRFYASASATPEMVYPLLIRNAKNHSKAIRTKIGGSLAEWFENQITDVAAKLHDAFPKTLTLQDQGRFALGYYHQREFFKQKRSEVPAELVDADKIADSNEDDAA